MDMDSTNKMQHLKGFHYFAWFIDCLYLFSNQPKVQIPYRDGFWRLHYRKTGITHSMTTIMYSTSGRYILIDNLPTHLVEQAI